MSLRSLPVLCLLLVTACSDGPVSDEDQLKALIEQAETRAEERKTSELMEMVADSFTGARRYDKKQLEKLLRLYFFRHQKIYLLTRVKALQLTAADHANVTVFVAMAGTAISEIAQITSLRGNIYRFDLEFIKDDDWLLSAATWQRARIEDLQ